MGDAGGGLNYGSCLSANPPMKRFWMMRCLRFFLLCVCLCLTGSLPCQAAPAKAVLGQIDLSTVDVTHGEVAALDGEWAFYRGRLLTPEDFGAGNSVPEADYVPLPSDWSKTTIGGQPLPDTGYATYRLRIKPPPGEHELALRIDEISSAYRLWINGSLAQECGVVARDIASEEKNLSRRIVHFPSRGEPVELLLQVSNFHGWTGAVPSIRLGDARILDLGQAREVGLAVLLAGGMLVMCIYHLAVYVMRRKELSFLYFSLYCLIRIDYTVFQGASDGVIRLLLPDIRGPTVYAAIMTGLYLSPLVSLAFFRSLYPQEFSFRVLVGTALITATLLVASVLNQFALARGVQIFFYAYSMILITYYLYCLFRAWRAKRVGADLILIGYVILGASLINDMLTDMQVIRSVFMIPLGMFIFVLFQSFALARRFTRAFSSVESLSDKLEEQNEILQADMAEHIRLEHEIELVGERERRAISRELHDGLCQQLTAARLHCSVLLRENKGRDKAVSGIEEMAGLLHGAVDHAYELSRGLWPVEHEERDLKSSLDGLVAKLRSSQPFEISLSGGPVCERCQNANASPIFYIAREALQNVCKHASASHVQIVLDCRSVARTLMLRIEDDGVGRIARQTSPGGLGLRIMAHRARSIGGKLTITDRPGGGTVVTLTVPCAMPDCPQGKEAES